MFNCSSPDVLDELGCAGTDSGNDVAVAGNFSIFFRHCTHSFCPFSSERFGWRSLISSVITRSEETTFFLCSLNGSQQQLLIFACLVPSMITTELNGCDAQGWLCKAMLWSASKIVIILQFYYYEQVKLFNTTVGLISQAPALAFLWLDARVSTCILNQSWALGQVITIWLHPDK